MHSTPRIHETRRCEFRDIRPRIPEVPSLSERNIRVVPVVRASVVTTRTRGTCGMPQLNRPASLSSDDRVISNRWLSSSSSSSSAWRDCGGRTIVLGQAAAHLKVHGALTNCVTCIAMRGEEAVRPIGQSLDFARERMSRRRRRRRRRSILEKCDARVFL